MLADCKHGGSNPVAGQVSQSVSQSVGKHGDVTPSLAEASTGEVTPLLAESVSQSVSQLASTGEVTPLLAEASTGEVTPLLAQTRHLLGAGSAASAA